MIETRETPKQLVLINGYAGTEIDLTFVPAMTLEEFWELCQANPDVVMERESNGEIVIMAPTTTETGGMNLEISGSLWLWAKRDGTGLAFDSSAGFTLPNGAVRSPDVSWVTLDRWNSLPDEERSGFARICPDFVVELRSESDRLSRLQAKMAEYVENGARLGWLIDPVERKVHVYGPGANPEVLSDPREVSGGPVLKEFVLKLNEVWG